MNLDDFTGKMNNIRANAFMKLLAISRLLDPAPISGHFDMNGRTFDLSQMESLRADSNKVSIRTNELLGDITRTLVNESYLTYERYITVLLHGQPELLGTDSKPREFINQHRAQIDPKTLEFLNFCRLVRNGLMHYEGRCSLKNIIEYKFLDIPINTRGLEGEPLPINAGIAISINEEMAIAVREMIVGLGIDQPQKFPDFNGR